ncbi:MAG TPA: sigma-70 family RNA polymerase sigma factor [Tepidisphaeraceae bacterium]|nr:sigma-70 family RNA polymerase sigma factor [Tepidisphaeraceae bacterium]
MAWNGSRCTRIRKRVFCVELPDFLSGAGPYRRLSRDEERRLRKQFLPGERSAAREKLVLANVHLVPQAAGRYVGCNMEWDDLVQEACVGLIWAVDNYDPLRVNRFRHFAQRLMMQRIVHASWKHASLIAMGHKFPLVAALGRFREAFIQQHGFAPSDQDVQDHFKLSDRRFLRLQQIRAGRPGVRRISQSLPCPRTAPPDYRIDRQMLRASVRRILRRNLDARTAEVIRRRFGIGTNQPETLEAIAKSFSCTRENIRQIECKGMRLLQQSSPFQKL